MSWQNFIDESLLGTSQVARASIHGLDGKRYASSAGFVVSIFLGVYSRFRKHSCVPNLYGSEVPITFICGNIMISLFRRL